MKRHIITVPDKQKIKELNEGFFDSLSDTVFGTEDENSEQEQSMQSQPFAAISAEIEETEIKPTVIKWLDNQGVKDYEIVCTGKGVVVNVHNHLVLSNRKLTGFPKNFRWGTVDGNCYLANNKFTSFTQFPEIIKGDLLCTLNYIRDFKNVPIVGGHIYAQKQRIRTLYKLNDENYKKYRDNQPILENAVYVPSRDMYGTLTGISENKKTCTVILEDNTEAEFTTHEVDVLDGLQYLLQ